MRFSKSSAKREVHSNTCLPQETRETSDNQPNFTPKTTCQEIDEQRDESGGMALTQERDDVDQGRCKEVERWKIST